MNADSTAGSPNFSVLPYQLVIAVEGAAIGGVFALLPEIRDTFGLSDTGVGAIAAAGFLAAFVTQLAVAPLADRGHAPTMIRVGLVGSALSLVWFTLGDELWELVAARAALGAAGGMMIPAIRRAVVTADRTRVGANLGRLASFEVGGFVLGPAISGALAEVGGLDLPFLVMAAITAAFIPYAMTMTTDPGERDERARLAFDLLGRSQLVGALLIVAGYFSLIGAFDAVVPLQLEDRGADTVTIGLAATLFALPIAVLAPRGGRFADRKGALLVASVAVVTQSIMTTAYGIVPGLYPLIGYLALLGIIDAFGFPAAQVLVAESVPEERLAGAQGLMGATEVGMAAIVALPAAAIYEHAGEEVVWPIVAGLMLVLTLSGTWLQRRSRRAEGAPPADHHQSPTT